MRQACPLMLSPDDVPSAVLPPPNRITQRAVTAANLSKAGSFCVPLRVAASAWLIRTNNNNQETLPSANVCPRHLMIIHARSSAHWWRLGEREGRGAAPTGPAVRGGAKAAECVSAQGEMLFCCGHQLNVASLSGLTPQREAPGAPPAVAPQERGRGESLHPAQRDPGNADLCHFRFGTNGCSAPALSW